MRASTQPAGVRTETPMPLSSQTRRSGTGRRWNAAHEAALMAPCAVEWFSEASPNEQMTIESGSVAIMPSGARAVRSVRRRARSRVARSIATAIPTAFGR